MFPRPLLAQVHTLLADHPTLPVHHGEGGFRLESPTPEGFPITFRQDARGLRLAYGACPIPVATESEALAWIAFGLSRQCRLRVASRGGAPWRWTVEVRTPLGWCPLHRHLRFPRRFWGSAQETTWQNRLEGLSGNPFARPGVARLGSLQTAWDLA